MKLVAYPRSRNPYQELLYGALTRARPDFRRRYLQNLPLVWPVYLPIAFLALRSAGYRLLHIHWQNFGTGVPRSAAGRAFRSLAARCILTTAKALRFRIVWTIHNVLPHEGLTSDDLSFARFLSQSAEAKIVHSSATIATMRDLGLDVDNVATIPHGNYVGVYPDGMSRRQARARFELGDDEVAVLFFGYVRRYKGVDRLVRLFREMAPEKARLIIAGDCPDPDLRTELVAAARDRAVDFYGHRIDERNVGWYFKACDVVCLPFDSVTTSGSALLALSFGCPLIAPLEGALRDLPGDVGFLYERDDAEGLRRSLAKAVGQRAQLERLGDNAREYAETLGWDRIAAATYEVYERVARGLPVRAPGSSWDRGRS